MKFTDNNNKRKYCDACDKLLSPMKCERCGISITYGHKMCNSCVGYTREPRRPNKEKLQTGWKRYLYNGIYYKSSWEVAVAEVLTKCEIKFEYERKDPQTNTWPDFYFPELDRYLEIHPDYHGKDKIIPDNCILVKFKDYGVAAALAVSLRLNPIKTKEYWASFSKRKNKKIYNLLIDLMLDFLQECKRLNIPVDCPCCGGVYS